MSIPETLSLLPVLSHFQTAPLFEAKKNCLAKAVSSIDCGVTQTEATLLDDKVLFANDASFSWEILNEINANKENCFIFESGGAKPIKGYSEKTGRSFSLYPTESAPAMITAGFPMHRIKNILPLQAAKLMIETLLPINGQVLDTATGLGYTSIIASKSASIKTIEFDPVAQEMAHQNPWSQELFNNLNIDQLLGDSAEIICEFDSGSFNCIMHDPPAVNLAGDLYSLDFYKQLHRVLTKNGKVFHYIGDPQTKSGASTTKGVFRRLYDAGFRKVILKPDAFGVLALK